MPSIDLSYQFICDYNICYAIAVMFIERFMYMYVSERAASVADLITSFLLFLESMQQKHITNLLVERRLKFGIRNQTGI